MTYRQVPEASIYELDPGRSSISFVTRHLFGSAKVTGSFDLNHGRIEVGLPATTSKVHAEADATSFRTKIKLRDKIVRSAMLLDAEKHPSLTFQSTEVRLEDGQWVLKGDLTVRGKTAPVEFAVTEAKTTRDGLSLHAEGVVDRYAHGITAGKGFAARRLKLDLAVHAVKVVS
ncbi:YceI family protein [Amycolatopsis pithecellobii]|uniref:YceI family protein n=1 Tax=Amycolatopsis pithecellobii TaxID=664692 RepID=A0A6N7YRS9_9PSEU|nr:YceI family protein [Amycolatopsis pithecellobii]MTD55735.1 YceI family protein [Amycolatopsis pithecellobii]